MKKPVTIVCALMLLVVIIPVACAEEESDIDAETHTQITLMHSHLGAEIRLLQLEKTITTNILQADAVVSMLSEVDYNTTILEAILVELTLIQEEVQTADATAPNATQVFIDLKTDAQELTHDFQESLTALVDTATREHLRDSIREIRSVHLQNLSITIQNKIRQFNTAYLQSIFNLIDDTDATVITNYQNGTITLEHIRQHIQTMVNQMKQEKRYAFLSQLTQTRIHRQIQAQIEIEHATDGFQERKQNRLRNRIQQVETMPDTPVTQALEQRIRNRLHKGNSGTGAGDNGDGKDNGTSGTGSGNQNTSQGNPPTGNGNNQHSGGGGH